MLLSSLPSPQPPWDSIFTPSLAGIYRLPVLPSQLLVLQGYAKMSDSFSSFFLNIDFSFLKHFLVYLLFVCLMWVPMPKYVHERQVHAVILLPSLHGFQDRTQAAGLVWQASLSPSHLTIPPKYVLMMYTCNPSTGRPKKENFQFEASLGCIGSSRPASLCCRGRPCLKRTWNKI